MNPHNGAASHHFDALDRIEIWSRFLKWNQAFEQGPCLMQAFEKKIDAPD